jgi:hypothetical protein
MLHGNGSVVWYARAASDPCNSFQDVINPTTRSKDGFPCLQDLSLFCAYDGSSVFLLDHIVSFAYLDYAVSFHLLVDADLTFVPPG